MTRGQILVLSIISLVLLSGCQRELSSKLSAGKKAKEALGKTAEKEAIGKVQPEVPQPESHTDWKAYSSDNAHRYSPLEQMTKEKVRRQGLEKAWSHKTNDGGYMSLQTTPLVIEGMMYYCSLKNHVIALNAEMGEEIWRVQLEERKKPVFYACRGVSYHKFSGEGKCSQRIYSTSIDGRLMSLDAKTGEFCTDFGENGIVDLWQGMGKTTFNNRLELYYTTAPAIYADKDTDGGFVVMGGGVLDNMNYVNASSGVIRAFDLKTGKKVWHWEPIPQGFNKDQRTKPESVFFAEYGEYQRGTPNAWTFITADPESELIFIPFGTATPDYFIGNRQHFPALLEYSSSLVALNKKGEYVWHYKTVRNDIWDYDIPAQPNLIDIEIDGETRKAVVVSTKVGHTFILDRFTGEELIPTVEKEVPNMGDVAEMPLASTQKFPTFPKPYYEPYLNKMTEPNEEWLRHLGTIHPDAEKYCRESFAESGSEGVFTPPSKKGVMQIPSNIGGSSWSGNSFDPERNILITNTNRIPTLIKLLDRQNPKCDNPAYLAYGGMAIDAPYCIFGNFLKPIVEGKKYDEFCTPPPWGEVLAFDMKNKKPLWRKPIGTFRGYQGSHGLGGILTTKTGVAFYGGTADKSFRALDIDTGDVLWKGDLPAHGMASPMTYSVNGVQYVAIAAGGHFFIDGKPDTFGNEVVVFKLKTEE